MAEVLPTPQQTREGSNTVLLAQLLVPAVALLLIVLLWMDAGNVEILRILLEAKASLRCALCF